MVLAGRTRNYPRIHSPTTRLGGRSYAAQQQELIERQHAARVAELEAIIAGLRRRMAEQTKAMNEVRRASRSRSKYGIVTFKMKAYQVQNLY